MSTSATEHTKDSFWKEFFPDLAAVGTVGVLPFLMKGGLHAMMGLFHKFTQTTGEAVAPHVAGWVTYKLFGLKTEDERRYNAAIKLLTEQERVVLSKRLEKLEAEQADYYRMTVMQDTPEELAEILRTDAHRTTEDWDRHSKFMNYKQEQAERLFQKFTKTMAPEIKNLYVQFDTFCGKLADEMSQETDRILDAQRYRRSRPFFFKLVNSFTRALALPWEHGDRYMDAQTRNTNPTNGTMDECGQNNDRRRKIGFSFCWKTIFDVGFYAQGKKPEVPVTPQTATATAAPAQPATPTV